MGIKFKWEETDPPELKGKLHVTRHRDPVCNMKKKKRINVQYSMNVVKHQSVFVHGDSSI